MLNRLFDDRVDALCSRCLFASEIVDSAEKLAELGWELRDDQQTWCPKCSVDARTPKRQPNQRGVVRQRRRRS